jgi:hypothetical protein
VGNHFSLICRPLNLWKLNGPRSMPDKSKIKFGDPLPGFPFKPGEWIVNSHWAEEFRRGICTQKQFDGMKMLVVEVGIDDKTKIEGYRLLNQLPGVVDHSSRKIVQWRLRIYVESNFEICDPSGDLIF